MTKVFFNFKAPRFFKSYTPGLTSTSLLKTSKPPWKVLFFGSDEFSLFSLKAVYNELQSENNIIDDLEVVTCSDKNPIWKFARQRNLVTQTWPLEHQQLNNFDLGLVVSFGHLIPEKIIQAFPLGMLNVHGSLLPRWRGASPITYALANGDTETGVTIMTIHPKRFDIGDIVWQEKVTIGSDDTYVELHKRLGCLGAQCLVKTLKNLKESLKNCRPQPTEGITHAPKLTPEFGVVKWSQYTASQIVNLERALKSLFPLKTTWNGIPVKLFETLELKEERTSRKPGFVEFRKKDNVLLVECVFSTYITVKQVGVYGKKVMSARDFYNGFISKLEKHEIPLFV
ncbi:hypothetical protein ABEB36_006351 [Hypothenemus hampei]|uniref:Methionyl-tRNA formyltransferase, mitochondrial n=1 Tax=Hypothenemus hampei TaxID=57062 RepID=A0ABD1EQ90_HYPHA